MLVAPPGAGKTTRVPPALLRAGLVRPGAAMVVLQPRRVAARSVASRMAHEQGWTVGREVGWHVRFDHRIAADTSIRVVTEGILTRQMVDDPSIEGVDLVILDEFHERSIHTDLALALLQEIRASLRPELRLLVMSATMDPTPVAAFLGGAPVVRSSGRLHPVEVRHLLQPVNGSIADAAALAVREVLRHAAPALPSSPAAGDPGHVLVFLPGRREIADAARLLSNASLPVQIHVLHSSVPAEEQDAALAPGPARKLILATNIAETSITIDGVCTVIDAGLVREARQEPRLGIDQLITRRVSRASADQRAGRAGRTAPGQCLRLWTTREEEVMAAADVPEIQRVDLTGTLLWLASYGVSDFERFGWFEPPSPAHLDYARRLLQLLGAFDATGRITSLGRAMAQVPAHPRLARLLIEGMRHGLANEAAHLAATLNEGLPEAPPAGGGGTPTDSNLLDLLEERERRTAPGANDPATRLARELMRSLPKAHDAVLKSANRYPDNRREALCRLLLNAYPDRVARRRTGDPTRGVMLGGRGVVLDRACRVTDGAFFLAHDPREATHTQRVSEAIVSIATRLEPEWLEEAFPAMVCERLDHRYDAAREQVVSVRQHLYGDLLLTESPASPRDDLEGAARALAAYIEEHAIELIRDDPSCDQFLKRARFLLHHAPASMNRNGVGELSDIAVGQMLAAMAAGCTRLAEVRGQGWADALRAAMPHRFVRSMDDLAPATIGVPSGRQLRLTYGEPDEAPVLEVKLQEMFGCHDTPCVANGVPVMLHLMSPGQRPVQVTRDLRSFWSSTYHEVRRELRARYPRHPWPDDPNTAPPTHRAKPRGS